MTEERTKNNILSVNTDENISATRFLSFLFTEISCVAERLKP